MQESLFLFPGDGQRVSCLSGSLFVKKNGGVFWIRGKKKGRSDRDLIKAKGEGIHKLTDL